MCSNSIITHFGSVVFIFVHFSDLLIYRSEFKNYLRLEEKSSNTIEKYTRDVEAFTAHINSAAVTKELVIAYKGKMISDGYSIRSINSVIASLNSFFFFCRSL